MLNTSAFTALRMRKISTSSNKAAWWKHVDVMKAWVFFYNTHAAKNEVCFVACKHCGKKPTPGSMNPANFAKTHFENHVSKSVCKESLKRGMSSVC